MNDDLLLSLHLDGRLSPEEERSLAARLAREPALRARREALGRLQALSRGLAPTGAGFGADDVRLRARGARGGWARLAAAAAAVLLLALTHAGAYLLGAERAPPAPEAPPDDGTAALLARAANLDFTAAPETLRLELEGLREAVGTRLVALETDPLPPRHADRLRQLDLAFARQGDPNVLGLTVSLVARGELRFVPATARTYTRLQPLGDGRFRLTLLDNGGGEPRAWVDEGTLPELERRHRTIEFVKED